MNENQQSWLKLLQKLLVPVSPPVPSWLDTTHKSSTSTSTASDQSLSSERQLPDVNSAPSLVSTEHSIHSSHTTESIREFILHLFDSDTTLNKASSPKIPSTPCNSAASVNGKPCKGEKPRSLSSGELREALRRLFCVSDDDLKKVLPGASDDSITSLGSAMRNLFFEELSPATKPQGLSTSNDSLSEAMHWLFKSQESLRSSGSSSSTDILWSIFDSEPEEYAYVDVRDINRISRQSRAHQRNRDSVSSNDCDCHQMGSIEKRNPSLSSVIRSSSPDRDVNISYPTASKPHQLRSQPHKSLIPRPLLNSVPILQHSVNQQYGRRGETATDQLLAVCKNMLIL